jgi:6-phosphogluconate dehydrogenase
MLPAGGPTEQTIQDLIPLCSPGDIIIDGGNTFYKDDIRRAASPEMQGIHYVDVGTSGGVWGLDRGYCMMIGGAKEAVDLLDPIFDTLAPGLGTIPRTAVRGIVPSADTSMPGRRGRGTSSRWCITASNTG